MRLLAVTVFLFCALALCPAPARAAGEIVDVTVVFDSGAGLVAQCPADVAAPGVPAGAAVQVMREDAATIVCQYGRSERERTTMGAATVLLAFGFALALYAIVKAARGR